MVLGISFHDQLAGWPLGLCKVEPEVEEEATHLLGAKKQQKEKGPQCQYLFRNVTPETLFFC